MWRDKYGIASEGQPSSKRLQVGPGHAPTGMQLVSLPLVSPLVVCSVKESDRLGWLVQAIMHWGLVLYLVRSIYKRKTGTHHDTYCELSPASAS